LDLVTSLKHYEVNRTSALLNTIVNKQWLSFFKRPSTFWFI